MITDLSRIGITCRIRPHCGLILAMRRNRQGGLSENLLQRRLFVNQQIPCTRSDKDFDPWCSLRQLEFSRIFGRRTHIKAVVDEALLLGQSQLLVQTLHRNRLGRRIRHL